MDGTFQAFDRAITDVTLGDRLARLSQLQSVFANLARTYPGNPHLARQHDAVVEARAILKGVADEKGLFARDYDAELEQVAALFEGIGARPADLAGMHLA